MITATWVLVLTAVFLVAVFPATRFRSLRNAGDSARETVRVLQAELSRMDGRLHFLRRSLTAARVQIAGERRKVREARRQAESALSMAAEEHRAAVDARTEREVLRAVNERLLSQVERLSLAELERDLKEIEQ